MRTAWIRALAPPTLAILASALAARLLPLYWLEIATTGVVFSLLAMGLNLLYGYLVH